MTQNDIVILQWAYTPPNCSEEQFEIRQSGCLLTVADGKAEARIDTSVFDRDPLIRRMLYKALKDRLITVELVTHKLSTLSKSSMVRIDSEGRSAIFVEPEPAKLVISGCKPDLLITDKDGKVVLDTREERIKKERMFGEVILAHCSKDALLGDLLRSFHAAVQDPGNELVHLYEIRDALDKRFRRKAQKILGVTNAEWDLLGRLANVEPLRQGRHRGRNAGTLRDAEDSELADARAIARKLIEGYLSWLETERRNEIVNRSVANYAAAQSPANYRNPNT